MPPSGPPPAAQPQPRAARRASAPVPASSGTRPLCRYHSRAMFEQQVAGLLRSQLGKFVQVCPALRGMWRLVQLLVWVAQRVTASFCHACSLVLVSRPPFLRQGLDAEALKVGIWSGEVTLCNLQVRGSAAPRRPPPGAQTVRQQRHE